MKVPSCPGLDGGLHWSDIVHKERTCTTCSHAIHRLECDPYGTFHAFPAWCDKGLRTSSYPCDSYEREPGVD